MSTTQTIYLAVIFIAVFAAMLGIFYGLRPRPLQDRLGQLAGEGAEPSLTQPGSGWVQRMAKATGPLARLSLPAGGWENSPVRIRFMNAGFRDKALPVIYFAAKTAMTLLLPGLALMYVASQDVAVQPRLMLALVVLLAVAGYVLPNVLLERRIAWRQREIFESLPDAVDLMTVCVEAGLGLDAALARTAQEMRLKSPTMAEELHLVGLEMRAGGTRERALRNLALRTGLSDMDALVAVLIQADRFGTSVADSLRVHAEGLRTKRRLQAEEAAAKLPVKLLFPLLFCIFPAMLVVLLGPSVLRIFGVLIPTVTGMR